MKEAKFEDVLREGLEDLYDAEQQIVKALPKMAKAATSEELVDAFQQHLDETKEQVKRLEKIFQKLSEQPGGESCEGMKGLLKEGEKLISEISPSAALDIALIAAAQKVEHYEIAGYGSVRTLAEMLGQEEIAQILQETLDEEKATDENLTEIAEGILTGDAVAEEEEGEDLEEIDDEEEEEEVEEGA
jgi:ferritin-like metal-binding protein YciE